MTTAAELTKPVWLNIPAMGVFSQEKPIYTTIYVWNGFLYLEVSVRVRGITKQLRNRMAKPEGNKPYNTPLISFKIKVLIYRTHWLRWIHKRNCQKWPYLLLIILTANAWLLFLCMHFRQIEKLPSPNGLSFRSRS